MGCIEVAATRTAISMARVSGRRCSGDEDIASLRLYSEAMDVAGELLAS
jgi:hypothetical protein